MIGSKRHLVFLSLFSILEILAVLIFPQFFVAVFSVCLITAFTFFIIYFKRKMYLAAVLFSFILLFSCINPYRLYIEEEKAVSDLVKGYDKAEIECSAVIEDCRNYGSYSLIFARIYNINGKALQKPFDARIGGYSTGALSDGDKLVFRGKAETLSEIEKDGFDTATYLRSKRVFASFTASEIIMSSTAQKQPLLSELRQFSKNIIYRYVTDNKDLEPASVSYAMFAGDKDYISDSTKEHFRRSGITHLICVSGMHLTIIMGVFFSLLSFFTLHKRTRCIAVIILCFLYTAFTGFTLSTIRAAIMCTISFYAMMSGKKSDGYISLFFALLAICTFSPYAVLDISLILSFSASLGILVFSELLPAYQGESKIKKALVWVWNIISVNLGAVLFTLPFACYFFGSISVFSVVATIATSYLCELLLTSLLLLMLISPVKYIPFLEPMLEAIGLFCHRAASILIGFARYFSSYKYAYTQTEKAEGIIFITVFAAVLIALTIFIAIDLRRAKLFCTLAIAILGIVFSFLSVYRAISDDGVYKISYFRQNEDDRQLSIKLEHHGYLIVNADSTLCLDKEKADFDIFGANNYLLIIPDNNINTPILCENIRLFGQRYGIRRVFVPKTSGGKALAYHLKESGIRCYFMPEKSHFGNTKIEFTSGEYQRICVDDGKTSSAIVFSDKYTDSCFDKEYDICAYFTRLTKNQFKYSQHNIPDCDIFYTRMGKADIYPGIENTYGKKRFYIKE